METNNIKPTIPQMILNSIAIMSFLFIAGTNVCFSTNLNHSEPDLQTMLKNWAESFVGKTDSTYAVTINFKTEDSDVVYHLTIQNKNFEVAKGLNENALMSFIATLNQYRKIYHGEMTAFTSVGRERWSDKTPLDFESNQPLTAELLNEGYFFIQRFFNTSPNDKINLSKEHARIVHGAYAIPLFYQTSNNIGVRSAWYSVEKGQQLNNPGDTNPFPQYFLIVEGEGYFNNGNNIFEIKKNEGYYIPPGTEHIFWNESDDPLIMIFMAWGEGA